ncbi:UNVERIFIED_CONTAM: hypothetical protein H355_006713 [Colinus virginianus]|nr:hypothetical protein H355_006713 [Colinus virginianus]
MRRRTVDADAAASAAAVSQQEGGGEAAARRTPRTSSIALKPHQQRQQQGQQPQYSGASAADDGGQTQREPRRKAAARKACGSSADAEQQTQQVQEKQQPPGQQPSTQPKQWGGGSSSSKTVKREKTEDEEEEREQEEAEQRRCAAARNRKDLQGCLASRGAAGPAAADASCGVGKAEVLLRGKLRTYQAEGVAWLYALHAQDLNGILADEMGLGKTLQTIALLARLAVEENIWGPHLIVVPTSVLLNWEREILRFCPSFKVLSYYGSAAERAKKRVGWSRPFAFHICLVSYATAVKDAALLRRRRWHTLVLDEAQHIKNFYSRRWETLLSFSSSRRLLLTGTPLQNSLVELWALLHFLMPAVFASHQDFKCWFSDPLTAAIEKNQLQRHRLLISKLHALLRPYLLRRLKRDVEQQMPKKVEHVLRCSLTRRQRVLYDEFFASRQVQQTLAAHDARSSTAAGAAEAGAGGRGAAAKKTAAAAAAPAGGSYRAMMNILMQLRKVRTSDDFLQQSNALRQLTPTPVEVFERHRQLLLRCTVLCTPRCSPGPPRI